MKIGHVISMFLTELSICCHIRMGLVHSILDLEFSAEFLQLAPGLFKLLAITGGKGMLADKVFWEFKQLLNLTVMELTWLQDEGTGQLF